jgi:hypothetical protein
MAIFETSGDNPNNYVSGPHDYMPDGDEPDCGGFWTRFNEVYGDIVNDPSLRGAESPYPDLYGAEAFAAEQTEAVQDSYVDSGLTSTDVSETAAAAQTAHEEGLVARFVEGISDGGKE